VREDEVKMEEERRETAVNLSLHDRRGLSLLSHERAVEQFAADSLKEIRTKEETGEGNGNDDDGDGDSVMMMVVVVVVMEMVVMKEEKKKQRRKEENFGGREPKGKSLSLRMASTPACFPNIGAVRSGIIASSPIRARLPFLCHPT
jgi:hypothetical protein